jgi:UDP-2-acetamido-3-amino-2,3-dideoxy-glucuronate N-acetyltransferase
MAEGNIFIHATAVVDGGALIGEGTRIWHFCHVMAGARIGRECMLGQGVFVADGAVLGDRVRVQNNVSVYGGAVIEDEVFLGPSCVLTNVKNPRADISRRDEYQQTLLKQGATIGANATIVCGITVGRYAFVGAGAVVTHDVPDHALVVGTPARRVGWVSRRGCRLPEPDDDGVMRCPESGEAYRLNEDSVERFEIASE